GLRYIIIGDLHGNFSAFDKIIKSLIKSKILNEKLIISKNYKLIGLGDYIDRGEKSLEVILTLMLLKILNPEQVILLRGNHEDQSIFDYYGFGSELIKKLDNTGKDFSDNFDKFFKFLPCGYFIKIAEDKFFQFNHAGFTTFKLEENFLASNKKFFKFNNMKWNQFLWNDLEIFKELYIRLSSRGRGYVWSHTSALNEMSKFNILAKFGGHQHALPKDGIEDSEKSDGFICLVKNKEKTKPYIYNLMSGSICFNESYNIAYFPSYLELHIDEKGWDVFGYVQRSLSEGFEKVDIKTVY
ncbi:hypothetical protein GF385_01820, partial [Candidatus Dependentiae bacterium]|nr:hypothetical protein [Candidatus Dependentiae bacterium]